MTDARLAATAPLHAERELRNREELRDRLRRLLAPRGDERALDAGSGVGAVAFALAPLVAEVVALDASPELLAYARRSAEEFPNVRFLEADASAPPPGVSGFDLACCVRVLHHVARPEVVVAELSRVTRPDGRLLVADQIAPVDPLIALDLDRFERARDPTHERTLPDVDFRALFDANGLVLERAEVVRETRELEPYLDLAGCEGPARDAARGLAPSASTFAVEIGWYVLRKPSISA